MPYTIGEVSAQLGIPAPTLRYYDKEGLLPFVRRSASGVREFSDSDLEWLHMIECLKRSGLSIKDIKEFVDLYVEGDSTLEQRRDIFYRRRAAIEREMDALKETLEFVNYKCWYYDTAVAAGTIEAPNAVDPAAMPEPVRRYKQERKQLAAAREQQAAERAQTQAAGRAQANAHPFKAVSGGEGKKNGGYGARKARLTA